jgi:DNA topoisomerase VI subunit B
LAKLQRTTFKTSRAAQYVERRALTSMTGQRIGKFADVVTKELIDNALDACEAAGVAPEITLEVEHRDDSSVQITVSDNAGGIPPEIVHATLDFNIFVSDKAAYRSPTRGAQGNALKTVFGIPYALGSPEPVVVEARGQRHEARVWKDPAGELRVQCNDTDLNGTGRSHGTAIIAHVPGRDQEDSFYTSKFVPGYWARAFSLFNPHSAVNIRRFGEPHLGESKVPLLTGSYLPTRDPRKRFKYLPSDPTSPHWYDEAAFSKLVHSHVGHHLHDSGEDISLRTFVRQFKGLSSTKKAKAICELFPDIKMLSDFEGSPEAVDLLLAAMQAYSDAPSHTTLGYVGREHLRKRFEEFYGEPYRFDYKKITGTLASGLPYVFEFAIAEVSGRGDLFYAVNYSPTFGDPLSDVIFTSEKISHWGIGDFVCDAIAHPDFPNHDDPDPPNTAVAVHVITPAPLFLDQGKTRLEGFTNEIEGPAIGKAMFAKLKPYYTEGKRRVNSRRSRERYRQSAPSKKEISLKDATAAVLEEAWRHTTGSGQLPVGARRLFYAVRSRIPEVTDARFSSDNGYQYFSQTLLPNYQQQRVDAGEEPLAGVYYDPRGKIHEAHTGNAMDLGTRDVNSYEFPPYTFNKLLYVEKRGQVPLLQAARLAERYDMALVTEAGFATVAARTLLSAGAEGEKYQVFCLHDADYPGYNILRTLREATERMPEHSMEVHDIGLTVEQVIAMGKTPENYIRSSKVPKKLTPLLNDVEREWFVGEYLGKKGNKDTYSSKRFELDDLTAPEVIEHIEKRLEELEVEPKIIPPDGVLAVRREQIYRAEVGDWVDEIIAEILATDELKAKMAEKFEERFKLQGARTWIETEFKHRDDAKSWRDALKGTLQRAYDVDKNKRVLKEAVREHIRQTVVDDAVEDD